MMIPPIYTAIVVILPTPALDPRRRLFFSREARRRFERTGKLNPADFIYIEALRYEPDTQNI